MTLQNLSGLGLIEAPPAIMPTGSYASMLIDASGEKAGFVFPAPATGNVRKLGILTQTVTSSQTLKISLQSVDASGDPSGTILGATNNGFATQASPASNTFYEVTLGETVSVTRGTMYAVVVEFNTTVGTLNIGASFIGTGISVANNIYRDLFTASWAKTAGLPVVSLEYDDGSYPSGFIFPSSSVASGTFSNASTPDEIGNLFQTPFPCKAAGIWFFGDLDGDTTFKLYDSDGSTVLESVTGKSAEREGTGNALHRFYFDTDASLSANTDYRVTALPGAGAIGMNRFTVASSSMLGNWPMGTLCSQTERTDAGAWTNTNTKRSSIGLILKSFDDGAGGGTSRGGLFFGGGM